MAAVTLNSQRDNINGSYRERFYSVTGASTNTLTTDLHVIKSIDVNDSTITKAAASGGVITFTSSGTFTGALVHVIGL